MTDRELDALVAEKVMGWTSRGPHPIFGTPVYATGMEDTLLPRFSTDLAAAWIVAEKRAITVTPIGNKWGAAWCNFSQSGETTAVGMTNGRDWVVCDSAARAICLAALQAVGVYIREPTSK